ncbi:hypothetical protein APY94_09280 [Thermococcus celericrescens]|uniref:Uncharacterized protein n=2 Tax=Thermococcus TaxID=2263 RepID=A0A100XWT6_9EURY|nr:MULTISPECIES: hypothetical protein [Thermococcus]KUH32606.1 hypothetical protein APY94_09280 [Thermococcus celericrescens]QEK15006.1 hypothetical protein FPV09_07775 [Thermococcus aciditolerans]
MEEKKRCEGELSLLGPVLMKLGGKEYLKLKRILEDAEKKGMGKKTLLLALQIPLLSAQEEVGFVLQLLRDVV